MILMFILECFYLCIFILIFGVNDLMINNSDGSQYGFILAFKCVETFGTTEVLCNSRYNYVNYSLFAKRFRIFFIRKLIKSCGTTTSCYMSLSHIRK